MTTAAHAPSRASPVLPRDVHVMILGLSPMGAAVALALLDCGVCALNVNDPTVVSSADLSSGHYGAEVDVCSREILVRRQLRRRSPVCVPLSAPELFPSPSLVPAITLRVLETNAALDGAQRETHFAGVQSVTPDPDLPTLTVICDGPVSLVGPVTRWQDQPCVECFQAVLLAARTETLNETSREHHAGDAQSGYPVTRTLTVLDLTAMILAQTLQAPDTGPAVLQTTRYALIRHGLFTTEIDMNTDCLCSWGA